VKEYLLQTTHSVGKVYHVSQFDIANMSGFFNTFGTRFRLDCITKAVSEINSSLHISIPADLYGHSFPCLSTKTYKNCREIHHHTFKMLSRRGQRQMKTNLDQMHIDPGMWWMLVSHMRKESSLATPTHPIYYDDRKSTYNTYSMQTTISNTL
jgi:hypothetical protein